jgi:hypothetical protein
MSKLALFCAIVLAAVAVLVQAKSTAMEKREEAIECVMRYVDVDPRDGCIDSQEVSRARINCVSFLKRTGIPRVETIMRDCDFDGNGCISREDMLNSNKTCLRKEEYLDALLNNFCPSARDDKCNE